MIPPSRYGDKRTLTDNGHGIWTITGKSHFYRGGCHPETGEITFFDPEGGPMIAVGDNLGFGTIVGIIIEQAPKEHFKVRLEVE